MNTSQNQALVTLHGGGSAHLLWLCLQGVSWGGHREFRSSSFFFFFFLLLYFVERKRCRIQATLLQYKTKCQSKSCQKLCCGSMQVKVSPAKQRWHFSLWWLCYLFIKKKHSNVKIKLKNKWWCIVLSYNVLLLMIKWGRKADIL